MTHLAPPCAPRPAPSDGTLFGRALEQHFRALGPTYFSDQAPGRLGSDPVLVHLSQPASDLLGLDFTGSEAADLARILSGHQAVPGFAPLAQVYAGHQFGSWVPRLGDGRAVMIAQLRDPGDRLWDLQLKGAGRTPYSRFGDGRAVLRSCLREYLASEAMGALGIPTTRALAVVATREAVLREDIEPGAVMTRLAPSHVRFGHFEYFRHTGQPEAIGPLIDHVIALDFPDCAAAAEPRVAWFTALVGRTAALIADWQAVGFAHGVMNTDNMSALGLTIDYGPFGFLDEHDPSHICNHSDHTGRYAFGAQPDIAFWNLQMLAMAVAECIPLEALREALYLFPNTFAEALRARMRAKLGLGAELAEDDALVEALMALMERANPDHTLTFRLLSDVARGGTGADWVALFPDGRRADAQAWLARYHARLLAEANPARPAAMDRVNPHIVLRNWVAESAIRAVEDEGDLETLDAVFRAVTDPYSDAPEHARWAGPPPPHLRALEVSCSS